MASRITVIIDMSSRVDIARNLSAVTVYARQARRAARGPAGPGTVEEVWDRSRGGLRPGERPRLALGTHPVANPVRFGLVTELGGERARAPGAAAG
jgi:hypothetical protein